MKHEDTDFKRTKALYKDNSWIKDKKIRWHFDNGDGFYVMKDGSIVFQGRNYLGYSSYKLPKHKLPDTLDTTSKGGV